jgi:hypothetical protein
MIDDRDVELLVRPLECVGVAALSGQEQTAQAAHIVAADIVPAGIFFLDGAKCGGRGEQDFDVVFVYDAPERAGVRTCPPAYPRTGRWCFR